MKLLTAFLALYVLSACTISVVERQPVAITQAEQAQLDNPPKEVLDEIDGVLPEFVAYARAAEAIALQNGRPLTDQETILANRVGVKHPEKIRIYVTNKMPVKDSGSGNIAAVTINYGIFVRPDITKKQVRIKKSLPMNLCMWFSMKNLE